MANYPLIILVTPSYLEHCEQFLLLQLNTAVRWGNFCFQKAEGQGRFIAELIPHIHVWGHFGPFNHINMLQMIIISCFM